MNKKQIGINFTKLRKKKKMTISELANKIHVKEKKIIKWEEGRSLPSLYNIKTLACLYDVKISKIVDEEFLLNLLIKNKKVNIIQIGLIILLILILTLVLLLPIHFNNSKPSDIKIYSFKGESDNFSFRDGLIIISDDKKYIEISNFDVKNNLDVKTMSINIAFNESIWAVKDYQQKENESAREWLNKIKFTEYGKIVKNELIDTKKSDDSFIKYDTIIFPNDFKVEINYCTKVDCTVELLDIEASKLESDNKMRK